MLTISLQKATFRPMTKETPQIPTPEGKRPKGKDPNKTVAPKNTITVMADPTGRDEDLIEVKMGKPEFVRLKKVLQEKNLTPSTIAAGAVIFIGAVRAASIVSKELTKRREHQPIRLNPLPPTKKKETVSEKDDKKLELFLAKVTQYYPKIYGFIINFVRSGVDADEISEKVFYNAYQKYKSFKPRTYKKTDENRFTQVEFDPYLYYFYKIASNLCKNHIRNQRRRALYMDFIDDLKDEPTTEAVSLYEETSPVTRAIRSILQKSGNEFKNEWLQIIYLKFFENLKEQEIATILGSTVSTVKSASYYSIFKIRELMIKELQQSPGAGIDPDIDNLIAKLNALVQKQKDSMAKSSRKSYLARAKHN